MKGNWFYALVFILGLTGGIGCISMENVSGLMTRLPGSGPAVLDEKTIIAGLKEALSIGTEKAVKMVSAQDGYFGNRAIKILLPRELTELENKLRKLGLGNQIDEFVLTMNRAAEKAAEKAVPIFVDAVKAMTLADAGRILRGENDAATRYFEEKTRLALFKTFTPVIHEAMKKVGLIKLFDFLIDSYNRIPLVKKIQFDIENYVNNKALDGLFHMLAGEEKKIRKDPAARVTELLRKVFG